ncbi:preprotein translocase subunit SecG [Sulfuritalea sp.]|uniref:preprotein translocase subunit SecG n=1 Tax=Sulfuritalea sp. TaxID=2480090 RepID=UPI00286EA8B3|nr:preprotein translocase subunit SecG [Sulfuritalea sp.]
MDLMHTVILTVHIIAGLSVIGFVLLQHGKGADMGAAFGSGASGSLFGATGSANFLSRVTAALAVVFFLTSLALSYIATSRPAASGSVMDSAPAAQTAPATPAQTPAAPESKAKDIPK